MKFAHGLLIGAIGATGLLYCFNALKWVLWKRKRAKVLDKAYDDFMAYKNDDIFYELNGGLEAKYIGVGVVHIIHSKATESTYDFSDWEEDGNPIGITLGDPMVKEEDAYIIPRVEVFKFNNGIITYRFKFEDGIVRFDESSEDF